MKMKVVIITLLSLLLLTNGSSLNSLHQVQAAASHDLAHSPQHWLGFPSLPRKLMMANLKVHQGFADKDLVAYDEQKEFAVSGAKSHDIDEEEATTTSKESRLFTMDYSPVRRRRPVHNKSLPTTTTSP